MANQARGLTIIDVAVVVGLIVIALLLMTVFCDGHHVTESQRIAVCKENLSQIGKAISAYTVNNGGYYPFSWMPADANAPRRKDAMASIARLYPVYLDTAKSFRCPSTENEPTVVLRALVDASYGYDCRVSPRVAGGHALMADMDGSWSTSKDTATTNHEAGQNVLHSDGHVAWQEDHHVSNDISDNIFAEDPWHADTDSFISDNTSPAVPVSATADQYNDLTVSYDPYPDLHPPK